VRASWWECVQSTELPMQLIGTSNRVMLTLEQYPCGPVVPKDAYNTDNAYIVINGH